MIVRITFLDEEQMPFAMLFGDSYKTWEHQYQEYLWYMIKWWDEKTCTKRDLYGVVKIEKCIDKWKTWGGLKWCHADDFQHELNREGCPYSHSPDNSNPRQYSNMVFTDDPELKAIAEKMYRERLRNLI